MSVLFGNLFAIRRGKEFLCCFLEARVKLSSSINENHLSNAIQFLGINMLACTEEEHILFFKNVFQQNLLHSHYLANKISYAVLVNSNFQHLYLDARVLSIFIS